MKKNVKRLELLDQMRGVAVILMIFFHFTYDLSLHQLVNVDFMQDPFWYWLPRFIVLLFLLSMGMSLVITHAEKFKVNTFLKRLGKLTLGALAISLVTFYSFRENWIYFGTLHCIAAASVCAIPFIKKPKLSLITGLGILSVFLWQYKFYPNFIFFKPPVQNSLDYIPLFPWFAIVLIGIYLGHFRLQETYVFDYPGKKAVSFLGRHSLLIYLLHQGILFPLSWLLSKLFLTR